MGLFMTTAMPEEKTSISQNEVMMVEGDFLLRAPIESLKLILRQEQRLAEAANQFQRELAQGEKVRVKAQAALAKLKRLKEERGRVFDALGERLRHLQNAFASDVGYQRWLGSFLDRLRADFLQRYGREELAEKLVQDSGLRSLSDTHLLRQCQQIKQAILNFNCQPALAWCTEHRASLRKLEGEGTKLEFLLKRQEFVELCRNGSVEEAMDYARRNLTNFMSDADLLPMLKEVSMLAVVPESTDLRCYKRLYNRQNFQSHANLFEETFYRLYGISKHAPLQSLLLAGLTALKTPVCGTPGETVSECPTCDPLFGSLAKNLPRARHESTFLRCRISGEVMSDDNPPMAIPNGYVYSRDSLKRMADENKGRVRCPRSGFECSFEELRRVYIT